MTDSSVDKDGQSWKPLSISRFEAKVLGRESEWLRTARSSYTPNKVLCPYCNPLLNGNDPNVTGAAPQTDGGETNLLTRPECAPVALTCLCLSFPNACPVHLQATAAPSEGPTQRNYESLMRSLGIIRLGEAPYRSLPLEVQETCGEAVDRIEQLERESEHRWQALRRCEKALEKSLLASSAIPQHELMAVWNMLLLCGEEEVRDLTGAAKLRALIDALIDARRSSSAPAAKVEPWWCVCPADCAVHPKAAFSAKCGMWQDCKAPSSAGQFNGADWRCHTCGASSGSPECRYVVSASGKRSDG